MGGGSWEFQNSGRKTRGHEKGILRSPEEGSRHMGWWARSCKQVLGDGHSVKSSLLFVSDCLQEWNQEGNKECLDAVLLVAVTDYGFSYSLFLHSVAQVKLTSNWMWASPGMLLLFLTRGVGGKDDVKGVFWYEGGGTALSSSRFCCRHCHRWCW